MTDEIDFDALWEQELAHLRAEGDDELADILELQHKHVLAAIMCDELDAGAFSSKRQQRTFAKLMQKRFGGGPWTPTANSLL